MKKTLLLVLISTQAVLAQVRYMSTPDWFQPSETDPRPNFMANCPVNFSMPKNHPYATTNFLNSDVNINSALNKGLTYTNLIAGVQGYPQEKAVVFSHDEWAHRYRPCPDCIGVGNAWLNHQNEETIANAYFSQGRALNIGMYGEDLEDFHDLNITGAKGLRKAWIELRRRARVYSNNPSLLMGGWTSTFYDWRRAGETAQQKSAGYKVDLNTLRSKAGDYGFHPLWTVDLYPDSAGHQRLIDGHNFVITAQYLAGDFRQDRTLETIQSSEIIHRAFPHLLLFSMHQPEVQMTVNAGQVPAGPISWFQGNYDLRGNYKGNGVWNVDPDMIPYDPASCWNLAIWGFMYGGVFNWEGLMPSGDPNQSNYHGTRQLWSWSYFHLASYFVGADAEVKSTMESPSEVDMVEFSLDGGASWKTGDDLLPAYAEERNLPIFRAKKSADGSKAVVLGYHQGAVNGSTTNVKIRLTLKINGVNTQVIRDFKAKRWTQMAVVS